MLVGVAQVNTALTTVRDNTTVDAAKPTSNTLSGPLSLPARKGRWTPKEAAILAASNTVAELRVSSSRVASCAACELSARTMIGQTLMRRRARPRPGRPQQPSPRHESQKHDSDDQPDRAYDDGSAQRGACQPSRRWLYASGSGRSSSLEWCQAWGRTAQKTKPLVGLVTWNHTRLRSGHR